MREIRRILCPVDLSDVSRHAIEHAIVLARWYGSSITALHVCAPVVAPGGDFAFVGTASPAMTEAGRRDLEAEVNGWFAIAADIDVQVIIATGRPAARILEYASATLTDLIVIGTHGHGGFEHLLLGSVAEKVLRRATCPVLTVPPRLQATSSVPFKRLLCAVDFSEPSLAGLDFALSLAKEGDADLTVAYAFDWPEEPLTSRPIAVPEYRALLERDTRAKLDGLLPAGAAAWCHASTRLVCGKPYREILRLAADDHDDLIVMGVHGRSALDVMLFGSTTNQVVRRATCPVLTLRK